MFVKSPKRIPVSFKVWSGRLCRRPSERGSILPRVLLRFAVPAMACLLVALPLPAIDLDSDGASDVWQQFYGVDSADLDLDGDSDGFSNREEAASYTDPGDSNSIIRITIPVGVAYGSDTEKAHELLLAAAREHADVLEDPAPIAVFEGFGDNALNFTLRCYLPNMDNYFLTINELHMAIDRAFREAGISIAFPQRDVHFDPGAPLEVRIMQEKGQSNLEV